MTREEFIDRYVKLSGLDEYRTDDGYKVPGFDACIALPYKCGDEACDGWAMVDDDRYGSVEKYRRRYA